MYYIHIQCFLIFNSPQVNCKASGGSFTLTFLGATTIPLKFSAQATDLVNALQALPTINGVKISMYGSQACLPTGYYKLFSFLLLSL